MEEKNIDRRSQSELPSEGGLLNLNSKENVNEVPVSLPIVDDNEDDLNDEEPGPVTYTRDSGRVQNLHQRSGYSNSRTRSR